ncbi:MAG: hypothetical protein KAR40_06545 [Candidatus Sabulitectum sp.]|nr:hypothetical protein [Candidatus Sabulitectum sp.]
MVVLSGEIGTPMQINSIKWHKVSTGSNAICENFSLYLGLCASDQLSNNSFDGNYISGTKTLVYSTNVLTVNQTPEWPEIILENSYWYNGTDNLIIEVQWENTSISNTYYCHEWVAGSNRCIYKQGSPNIVYDSVLPQMVLSGVFSLENSTFASIKVELGL